MRWHGEVVCADPRARDEVVCPEVAAAMEKGGAPVMLNTPRSLAALCLPGNTSTTSAGRLQVAAAPATGRPYAPDTR